MQRRFNVWIVHDDLALHLARVRSTSERCRATGSKVRAGHTSPIAGSRWRPTPSGTRKPRQTTNASTEELRDDFGLAQYTCEDARAVQSLSRRAERPSVQVAAAGPR